MAKKRKSSPPKYPTPPPPPPQEEEAEEEEEIRKGASIPVTSKPFSKRPTSKKSTSAANHTQNSDSSEKEGDDDEDSYFESEKTKHSGAQIKPSRPKKQKEKEEESDSEAESGSGSDSEPPATKPNSSKPKDGQPKPKKPSTKAGSVAPSKKQPAANESSENSSKKRPSVKERAPRVFGPDDVIRLLKGMIEFAEMGRADAHSDLTLFNQFINKSLQHKVSRKQMHGKIRNLKCKFGVQLQKEKKRELIFSRPFDKAVYKLSKKIWGPDDSASEDEDDMDVENDFRGDASNTEKKGGGSAKRRGKNVEERVEQQSSNALKSSRKSLGLEENLQNNTVVSEGVERQAVLYPHLNELMHSGGIVSASGLGERDVKRAFELIRPPLLKEWNERYMKMRSKERDISMERATLAYELIKQCNDLLKSSPV